MKTVYERVYVQVSSLNEELVDQHKFIIPGESNPSVLSILELIATLPLKQQVFMMANLLTVSGYEQKEIAEAMGVAYKTYRNNLWDMRKQIKDKTLKEW